MIPAMNASYLRASFFALFSIYSIAILFLYLTPESILFMDDQAFSQGLAQQILSGHLLLGGLPSHLGGRHLGPFYLWFVSSVHFFSRDDFLLFVQLTSLIKLISLGLLFLVLRMLSPSIKLFWISSLILLSFMLSGYLFFIITVDWANHLLLSTSAILLVTYLFTLKHGWPLVIPFTLATSIAAQTHLSSLPLILMLSIGLIARLLLYPSIRLGKTATWLSAISTVCLLLIWIPPAVYEFSYSPNIQRVVFERQLGSDASIGLYQSMVVFASLLQSLFPVLESGSLVTPYLFLAFICFVPLIIIKQYRIFLVSNIAGILLAILVVARIPNSAHNYYFISIIPSLCILFGLTIYIVISSIEKLRSRRLVSSLAFIVIGVLAVLSSISAIREFSSLPPSNRMAYLHALEVSNIIQENLTDISNPPKIFVRDEIGDLRADTLHLLVAPNGFDRMRYRKVIQEMPRILPPPSEAFLLQCGKTVGRRPRQMMLNWEITQEISLANCSSCKGCLLLQMSRRSVSP